MELKFKAEVRASKEAFGLIMQMLQSVIFGRKI